MSIILVLSIRSRVPLSTVGIELTRSRTQAEIDEILTTGGDQSIFTQQLLQERSTQAAKNALADIQDKHRDIMKLEQVPSPDSTLVSPAQLSCSRGARER